MKFPEFADPYRRRAVAAAAACFVALVLLTLAVATGMTDDLDVAVRERFRPDFIWGTQQQRASHVVSALDPLHMIVLLAIGSTAVAVWRLNVWPVVQAGGAVAATGMLTLTIKVLIDRADPRGEHTSLGGSFPSGHSATLMIATLTGAMLISCPTRWWQRFGVGLLWVTLSLAMLCDGVHWLSDIVGGALAAGTVLGVVATFLGPSGGAPHVVHRRARRGTRNVQSKNFRSGKV